MAFPLQYMEGKQAFNHDDIHEYFKPLFVISILKQCNFQNSLNLKLIFKKEHMFKQQIIHFEKYFSMCHPKCPSYLVPDHFTFST
jgi:hypothetical protein